MVTAGFVERFERGAANARPGTCEPDKREVVSEA
jgi:hypothetical protein